MVALEAVLKYDQGIFQSFMQIDGMYRFVILARVAFQALDQIGDPLGADINGAQEIAHLIIVVPLGHYRLELCFLRDQPVIEVLWVINPPI